MVSLMRWRSPVRIADAAGHQFRIENVIMKGHWLWLNWWCSCFLHQRSTVQILSLANFYTEHLFTYRQLYHKDENKEKEAGNGPF